MPTLGYSARDPDASLRNVSIKDMQGRGVGGCSAVAKLVFFVCEALNSILNMVGYGA